MPSATTLPCGPCSVTPHKPAHGTSFTAGYDISWRPAMLHCPITMSQNTLDLQKKKKKTVWTLLFFNSAYSTFSKSVVADLESRQHRRSINSKIRNILAAATFPSGKEGGKAAKCDRIEIQAQFCFNWPPATKKNTVFGEPMSGARSNNRPGLKTRQWYWLKKIKRNKKHEIIIILSWSML